MSQPWDTELEEAVTARLRSQIATTDAPYIESFATLGLADPPRSPSIITALGKAVTIEESYVATRAHITIDQSLFVNYTMQSSDPISGSALRGVRGLRDLARQGQKALLGHTPQFTDISPEAIGFVGCLRLRGQELYQVGEGPTIEIEQEWSLKFQLQRTQS